MHRDSRVSMHYSSKVDCVFKTNLKWFFFRFKISPNKFSSEKDWSTDTVFSCYICFAECEGFADSVTHIREDHPEVLEGEKTAHCIVCPKVFARRDHLKNHLWRHVNRVHETPRHSMRTFRPGRLAGTTTSNMFRERRLCWNRAESQHQCSDKWPK